MIEKRGHSQRTLEALKTWVLVVRDYENKISIPKILEKYRNTKTDKPMTRQHLYYIFKRFDEIKKTSPELLNSFSPNE